MNYCLPRSLPFVWKTYILAKTFFWKNLIERGPTQTNMKLAEKIREVINHHTRLKSISRSMLIGRNMVYYLFAHLLI